MVAKSKPKSKSKPKAKAKTKPKAKAKTKPKSKAKSAKRPSRKPTTAAVAVDDAIASPARSWREDAPYVQAILADPDDDAPRLVYADVLQQRGDPRGEYIAVQCELAREGIPTLADLVAADLEPTDPRYSRIATLLQRELALWRDHHRDWIEDLDDESSADVGFARGLPASLELQADTDLARVGAALARAPIRSLHVSRLRTAQLAELAATPGLARIERLVLDLVEDRADALAPLLAATPRLVELALRNGTLASSALASCRALVRLDAERWTADALAVLQALPRLAHLRVPSAALAAVLATERVPASLALDGRDQRASLIAAIVSHAAIATVRQLAIDLDDTPRDLDELLSALVRSPHLAALETFELGGVLLANARFERLSELPAPRLRSVVLSLDDVDSAAGRAFLEAHPTVRRLELWGGFDVDGWARMLAGSPAARNLHAIALHSRPAPDAIATLLRSPHLVNLRALELREDVTEAALAAVAAAPRPALVQLVTNLRGRQAIPGLPNLVRRND